MLIPSMEISIETSIYTVRTAQYICGCNKAMCKHAAWRVFNNLVAM